MAVTTAVASSQQTMTPSATEGIAGAFTVTSDKILRPEIGWVVRTCRMNCEPVVVAFERTTVGFQCSRDHHARDQPDQTLFGENGAQNPADGTGTVDRYFHCHLIVRVLIDRALISPSPMVGVECNDLGVGPPAATRARASSGVANSPSAFNAAFRFTEMASAGRAAAAAYWRGNLSLTVDIDLSRSISRSLVAPAAIEHRQ